MIVEWPVVSRDEVVAALRGGSGKTADAVLRTARRRGVLGAGVSSWVAESGALHGRTALWCSLTIDAARCARRGLEDHARLLAAAARRIDGSEAMRFLGQELRIGAPGLVPVVAKLDNFGRSFSYDQEFISGPIRDALESVATESNKWREKADEPNVSRVGGSLISVSDQLLTLEREDGGVFTLGRPPAKLDYLTVGRHVIVTSVPVERELWSVQIAPGWALQPGHETVFHPFRASVLPPAKASALEREIIALTPIPLSAS
jgi:hypothetical protein